MFSDTQRRQLRFDEIEHPLIPDTQLVAQDVRTMRPEIILPAPVVIRYVCCGASTNWAMIACAASSPLISPRPHLVSQVAGDRVHLMAGKRQGGLRNRGGITHDFR
jgi:hypothetical protein